MNCASCGTALPDAAAFCSKCGKPQPAAGTSRAAPPAAKAPPPAVSAAEAGEHGEGIRWLIEQQSAFNAWRKKLKFVAIPAGLLAFGVTLAALVKTGPFAFAIAAVVGILVATVVETEILPRVTFPTIPCPYCGGQVSIAERPRAFRRWERTHACPHCKHPFPH